MVTPLSVKLRGGRRAVVTPGILALERRQDVTLIKAVARAFRKRSPAALLPVGTGIVLSPSKLWGIEPALWSTLLTTRRVLDIGELRS